MTDQSSLSFFRKLLGPLGLNALARTNVYKMLRDPYWHFSVQGNKSRTALLKLKDIHKGETGFIIGTGPSLLQMDLSGLQNRHTIGLNRLYLGFDSAGGLRPSYMMCVNQLLLDENGPEFCQLEMPLFANWESRKSLTSSRSSIFVRTLAGTEFHKNVSNNVSVGSTVTYAALQVAYWMGFQRVILLGIDHNYKLDTHELDLAPHTKTERSVADINHFHPDYFGKGSKWQLPDLETSERAYRIADSVFKASGRQIFDATENGKLEVFEKIKLSDVLNDKTFRKNVDQ